MFYCPILIPTLNRYEKLKNCIESLGRCVDADKTELYISVDYPPSEKYKEGYRKVSDYLKNTEIKCFKQVHLFFQNSNLGAYSNSYFLIDQIKEKFEWYIMTEDDNEFAPGYLRFINKAIEKFSGDPSLLGIDAFKIETGLKRQAWMKGFGMTYGYARPVAALEKIKEETGRIYSGILPLKDIFKLYKKRPLCVNEYADFLLYRPKVYFDKDGSLATIDYTKIVYTILKDCYVVSPLISYVKNLGTDGSGLNSGVNKELFASESQKKMYEEIDFEFTEETMATKKELKKLKRCYFGPKEYFMSFKGWIKILLIKTIGLNKCREIFKNKNGI
jgi:glycosyltransferase involved in cell wall biosynthesis